MHAHALIRTRSHMHTHQYKLLHTCTHQHTYINTRTQRHARTLFLHLGQFGFDQFYKKNELSLYAY